MLNLSRARSSTGPLARALCAAAALAAMLLATPDAPAQGRCGCNNGCHMYPGQCVQGGGTGCDPGYAAFCGMRSESCPRTGWVSCSGTCVCVHIPGYDAGVADVPASMPDAPSPGDAPRPADVPASMPDSTSVVDAPRPADAPASMPDSASPGDAPSPTTDVPPGFDAPATPSDLPASSDAPSATDAPCVCPGGVCVAGRCITEHCSYQPELGFICAAEGTTCRVVDNEPWCVPACLDVSCAQGEFCDERANGQCVPDHCATIRCASGETCFHDRCVGPDGGTSDGSARPPATAADDGGCGCRATGGARGDSTLARLILALAAVGALRSRRTRRSP